MQWDKLTKVLQFTGAVLAVPAAAGGTYSAYRTYFTPDVVCQNLRSSIVTTMDRNVEAEVKRALLQRDVAEFERTCAAVDPNAHAIFQSTMHQLQQEASAAAVVQPAASGPARDALNRPPGPARDALPASAAAGLFGVSPAGERRGWVVLVRRDPANGLEINFEGFALDGSAMPPPGTRLNARHMLPVWSEAQRPGSNDWTRVQGRLLAGGCVAIVGTQPGGARLWAEVTPCS